jgi:hypothetical protein
LGYVHINSTWERLATDNLYSFWKFVNYPNSTVWYSITYSLHLKLLVVLAFISRYIHFVMHIDIYIYIYVYYIHSKMNVSRKTKMINHLEQREYVYNIDWIHLHSSTLFCLHSPQPCWILFVGMLKVKNVECCICVTKYWYHFLKCWIQYFLMLIWLLKIVEMLNWFVKMLISIFN